MRFKGKPAAGVLEEVSSVFKTDTRKEVRFLPLDIWDMICATVAAYQADC